MSTIWVTLAFALNTANAQLPFLDLNEKVIREPNPFSFISLNSNVDLSPEDFQIANKKGHWVENSLQWVRIGNGRDEAGLLVPRARFRETLDQKTKEIEVSLTQVNNPIQLRFRPRKSLKAHYYLDSSCSPFDLQIDSSKLENSWVMITCHPINNEMESGSKPVLLTTVLWESETGGKLEQVQIDSENQKHFFSSNSKDSFSIQAQIPKRFYHLNLSAGLGPYSNRNEIKAFPTLYASYYLNDAFKLASFGAFPVRSRPEIDWGFYLVLEQFRGIDERISLNFLLGAHVLSYVPNQSNTRHNIFSGPQGIELIVRDFLVRKMNLVLGGFFYPKINDRSYVNSWIRYGSNRFFLEFNYIQWQEPEPFFYSKSAGISVGFPLFRAF